MNEVNLFRGSLRTILHKESLLLNSLTSRLIATRADRLFGSTHKEPLVQKNTTNVDNASIFSFSTPYPIPSIPLFIAYIEWASTLFIPVIFNMYVTVRTSFAFTDKVSLRF